MGERILVVDGHPDADRKRFCHTLAEAYADGARATGKAVRLITLAEADIPLLHTSAEFASEPTNAVILRAREDLLWCDHLVLVFPLWLGGAPAFLRAFFEQVARASFMAETSAKGIRMKLKGRSARLIVTMGMPALIYSVLFQENGIRNIMHGILRFGGFSPIKRTLFGAVEASSAQTQKRRVNAIRQLGRAGA